ncbi:uncharacterized protein BO95DRAFT_185292 [Aspergillus brunneoviolaceus CBS 621.78]|uniref:Uncharacterized protein n=1 Tax=Aspergillus brunneoviolaceus CBS 621.78 TaxID=1450534 RepID=A0ACD1G4E0_9EURO|nr:hypothetical protein BO95DRAFT_185292 [Aspergillus brunneoviolaceus CBS 621.78]RAH44128.1 hypothetical protein BO95DRAFT_185292 [Aspergillus brunneoviolaceus CBS 621.78]
MRFCILKSSSRMSFPILRQRGRALLRPREKTDSEMQISDAEEMEELRPPRNGEKAGLARAARSKCGGARAAFTTLVISKSRHGRLIDWGGGRRAAERVTWLSYLLPLKSLVSTLVTTPILYLLRLSLS